jgi:hypothetical protein
MKKLFIALIIAIMLNGQLFGNDADIWNGMENNEQKAIFVGGILRGFMAAEFRAQEKYKTLIEAAKNTTKIEEKQKALGGYEVWKDLSDVLINTLFDKDFIYRFIKYLDYYFTDPNNQNAYDALNTFLLDQSKNK